MDGVRGRDGARRRRPRAGRARAARRAMRPCVERASRVGVARRDARASLARAGASASNATVIPRRGETGARAARTRARAERRGDAGGGCEWKTDFYARVIDGAAERPVAVCLGKFDAMHRGHYALAERASARGDVVLVSFAGMAETLGWEPRLPITAPSDRTRVMGTWTRKLGVEGVAVREHSIGFRDVRQLSPEAFVETLARMGVGAIVAGENYRFGYKAAGDAADLKRFGEANGMVVDVVDLVAAKAPSAMGLGDQVSSSRVRRALAEGNIDDVNWMLDREHRVVLDVSGERTQNALRAAVAADSDEVNISLETAENQPPNDGTYIARVHVDPSSGIDDANAKTLTVKVSYGRVSVPRFDAPDVVFARGKIAIDFVSRVSARYAMGVSGRW